MYFCKISLSVSCIILPNLWNLKVLFSQNKFYCNYCKEGTEMRQLVFRSADVYCQNLNNLYLHNIVIFILNRKKGKRASARRDRERVCARDGALLKMWLASVLKTAVGRRINYIESSENQHIKIMFFPGKLF